MCVLNERVAENALESRNEVSKIRGVWKTQVKPIKSPFLSKELKGLTYLGLEAWRTSEDHRLQRPWGQEMLKRNTL